MPETRLRCTLETISCNPSFLEYATLDITRYCFRIAIRLLGLSAVINVIWPQTIQRHMGAPPVVPGLKSAAEEYQMIEALDERNAIEPLVLERLNDAFGHSDGLVFSYSSQAWLHIPSVQQLCEYIPNEYTRLIRDDVFGGSMFFDGTFQSIVDPSGIASFQRRYTHNFAGEMVDRNTDLDRPYAPIPHLCRIDRPDVIWVPRGN